MDILLVILGIAAGSSATMLAGSHVAANRPNQTIAGREARWSIAATSERNGYTLTNVGNLVATVVKVEWARGTIGSGLINNGPYDHVMPGGVRDLTCIPDPRIEPAAVTVHWISVHTIISGHARNQHLGQTITLPTSRKPPTEAPQCREL
jgi:hypothetical protein